MESLPECYPLTALQIGDIQSYVSRAFIYLAPLSHKVFVLVDNRPWLSDKHSKSAKLWQLMVTKYRISPFMNTKLRQRVPNQGGRNAERPLEDKPKQLYRWLPSIDSAKWQEKYLFSVMDLSKALHGFLVFEVAWNDVHGINYLNELQADTSLALEVKSMRKWEFYSPEHALICASLWFSGRILEIQSLRDNFRNLFDFFDAPDWSCQDSRDFPEKKNDFGVFSDKDFSDVLESPSKISKESMCSFYEEDGLQGQVEGDDESDNAPTHYSDKLVLLRFDDCLLPFKLKNILMSDVRLLTLLESGLPSWVIFFQSYPLFCQFYRPWMRHFARTLYILISLITVIIGFYDLYKNVPPLKAMISRLCGPLFGWIEAWDMISRIRYLGTMLFLQNIEKGFKWFVMFVRSSKPIVAAITRPLAEFLSPVLNLVADIAEVFSSTLLFVMESMHSVLVDLFDLLIWPFEQLYSFASIIAIPVYSWSCSLWDFLVLPVNLMFEVLKCLLSSLSKQYYLLKEVWKSATGIFQVSHFSEVTKHAQEVSIWKGLWNDLFSQVFRATRSVINGLLAFFVTCNRHRLSIYNHIQAFFLHLGQVIHVAPCGRPGTVVHCKESGNANRLKAY